MSGYIDFLNELFLTQFVRAVTIVFDMIESPNGLEQIGDANNWFIGQYSLFSSMALWLLLPLVLIAVIHSVFKGSMDMLIKCVLVYPLLALLGTVIAVQFIELLIGIVDGFCRILLGTARDQLDTFVDQVSSPAQGDFLDNEFQSRGRGFLVLIISVFGLLAAGMTIVMLILRDASIFLATAFLPIGFAMLVWPATAKWFRRIVEFLIAMIFSKLVMVAAIVLAVSAFTGSVAPGTELGAGLGLSGDPVEVTPTATATAGAAGGGSDDDNTAIGASGIFALLSATALFIFTACAPALTSRMVGNLGLEGAADAFNSAMARPSLVRPAVFTNRMLGIGGSFKGAREAGAEIQRKHAEYDNKSWGQAMLEGLGHNYDAATGFAAGDGAVSFLRQSGEPSHGEIADFIISASRSEDPNEVFRAREMLRTTQDMDTGRGDVANMVRDNAGNVIGVSVNHVSNTGQRLQNTHIYMDIVNRSTGEPVDRVSATQVDNMLQRQQALQRSDQAANPGTSYHTTVHSGLMPQFHKSTIDALGAQTRRYNSNSPAAFQASVAAGPASPVRVPERDNMPPVDGAS